MTPTRSLPCLMFFCALAWHGPRAALAAPGDTPVLAATSRDSAPVSAVSVHALGLASAGLTLQYERLLPERPVSLAGLAGVRASAAGDYASRALSAGLVLRYWLTGRAFRSRLGRTLVGPYIGARIDVMRTTTDQRATDTMPERAVGASLAVTESVDLGYRFALWRKLEITPSAGLAVRTDIDTRAGLPPSTRATITLGLTVGWLM